MQELINSISYLENEFTTDQQSKIFTGLNKVELATFIDIMTAKKGSQRYNHDSRSWSSQQFNWGNGRASLHIRDQMVLAITKLHTNLPFAVIYDKYSLQRWSKNSDTHRSFTQVHNSAEDEPFVCKQIQHALQIVEQNADVAFISGLRRSPELIQSFPQSDIIPQLNRVKLVVDVKIQEIAHGRTAEQRQVTFSGKHKYNGIKTTCCVTPQGLCVFTNEPGSLHDKTFFEQHQDVIKNYLGPNNYIMADSGYQGIQTSINAVLPFKKPKGRELLQDQITYNNVVKHHRIIVEHFFGRLTIKSALMKQKYTMHKKNYTTWILFGYAFTNFHILQKPMRRVEDIQQLQMEAQEPSDDNQDIDRDILGVDDHSQSEAE
ncbi:Conserved_hypothetical protein [Hexamita inflata]|uniref:DDE Tnp4 domain-containing protein n=1 Tax=Hexamita inflata TaxID=28002 RepID=A0AA86U1V9_9EUKA|nr:Conserved hypothetical protein [Hexamita inflata]